MNFVTDVVEAAPPDALALVELAADGSRREHRFGDVAAAAAALAAELAERGVRRGDVVLTLIGNRPEWVIALTACVRQGFVALPCTEQLRPKDLAQRIAVAAPVAVVADRRNAGALAAAGWAGPVVAVPGDRAPAPSVAAADLADEDPCLVTFTSGTSGEPKAVLHAQRYLLGQRLQAEQWLDARPGDLVWCTAATGWSKSARNVFIAPWLSGAAALLHDARFDPAERMAIARRERVDVLCMAPTEYRLIASGGALGPLPSARSLVAAGEALDASVLRAWREATGLAVRDGYGQTETGQITGNPPGVDARPGSMGRPLPGVRAWVEDGELVVDPATVPTFFLGYLGEPPRDRATPWRTGDRVTEDPDRYLRFVGRSDDVIISAGYRIGPFEVESALASHPAVLDAAVVAAPDPDRGSIVRAVVVLHDASRASAALARELQEHVKAQTAPYKYPRLVEFADALPRTPTGKVSRAALRAGGEALSTP
jgi:acyl-coenzyme A synthetase/AMP-(fatty) acid ligase